jgi:hypothetical protein
VVRSRGAALPEYVEESLKLLERETPVHFAAVKSRLGGLTALIRVDDAAPFRLDLATTPWIGPAAEADVDVGLSPSDIEGLLTGALTIEEAITHDRLAVRGELDHVLDFLDALGAWLHGAIRAQSMPALSARYIDTTTI